jgi:hypothetical protein
VYSHFDSGQCSKLSHEDLIKFERCNSERRFTMLDASNYAAQIGWWLNFFPPERFVVVSSLELRDGRGRIEVCWGLELTLVFPV